MARKRLVYASNNRLMAGKSNAGVLMDKDIIYI